jgi:hypothetical protein
MTINKHDSMGTINEEEKSYAIFRKSPLRNEEENRR